MRQYKFRGKRIDNGEWVYGYIYRQKSSGCNIVLQSETRTATTKNGESIKYEHMVNFDVDPDTVGQFTGLKDDNGNEVYTGDLCKLSSDSFYSNSYVTLDEPWGLKVEIIDYGYAYAMRATEDEDLIILLVETYWEDFDIKVVGNRWDNPELMEE